MKKNKWLLIVFILLAGIAWWVYRTQSTSTLTDQPLADFTIEDTASVNKIFIVDHLGNTCLLERSADSRLWTLNKKYKAREDAINLILKTLNRIRVRGNVPIKGQENMLRVIASSGKKVEIYQGGDSPTKIYYVGPATPDHFGTVMLLEIPGIGRSSEPYITHMEGFTGFLNTRFFADELEWRYTGVFDYPDLDFNRVRVLFHHHPSHSFEVVYTGGNDIALNANPDPISGQFKTSVASFDTLKVKELLRKFKKVHFESYRTHLKPAAEDSIKRTIPAFTISVRDKANQEHVVELYRKKGKELRLNALGELTEWDPEYYWGKSEDGYLGLAQMFVFDPLLQPFGWYTGEITEPVAGISLIK